MKLNGLQWLAIGTNIAFTIVISVYLGLKLDEKFDTKPKFFLLLFTLSIVSIILMFYKIYKRSKNLNDKN